MITRSDVALILWNPDIIDLMSLVLLRRHLKSCGVEPSEGLEKIEALISSQNPGVVVFDLEPPYERSGAVARELLKRFPDRRFILTCADRLLALKYAPWLCSQSIIQKPYEVDQLAKALRSIVRPHIRRVPARSAVANNVPLG